MALRWYKQVWADRTLDSKPASYKLIMLALADFGDKDTGKCNPSVATISEMVGIKERQTQNIIHALAADGYIKISILPGRNRSNEYTLVASGAAINTSDSEEKAHLDAPRQHSDESIDPQPQPEKVHPSTPQVEEKVHPSTPQVEEKVHPSTPQVEEKVHPSTPQVEEKVHPSTVKGAPQYTRSNIDPKDDNDHLPGKLLRAMVEDAGFVYIDRNFNEVACKLEADYSYEQLIRALQSTKEAHQKKVDNGERGIIAPLAYMKTVLIGDGNNSISSNGTKQVVKAGKPIGVFVGKAENLR